MSPPAITVAPDKVFPILKQSILVDGFHVVVDLQRSRGNLMVDALTGREYLDCYTYVATLPLGHNHPGLEDEGFRRSLLAAALANPANSDVYAPEYAGFVDAFRRLAMPAPFVHAFFVAGGTLAVENAMKAAFDWKVQKNRARGLSGGGDKVLHFREAFHGRSGYCLSVTNTDATKIRDFPKFDWPRIENPKLRFPKAACGAGPHAAAAAQRALEETLEAERRAVAAIAAAFDADPHGIAAILVEPIQGEGGDNHFRPEFLRELRRLADEREALLVFDEVQTGVGLTGSLWAYQQLGVVPDLLVFGKKTQVCGFMATRRIDEVPANVFAVSSRINSTWGGNLVDMVRCARYLQLIEEERLVERAARVGETFLAGLRELQARTPHMDNARGRGLMLAFDLPDTQARNALRTRLWEAGLATLACGTRTLRFRPALVFGEAEVARTLELLDRALAAG
jgi:L-lysine 6-transaminase